MPSMIPAVLLWALSMAAPAFALEVQVKGVTTGSSTVHAAIELRDVVPDRFKHLLEENRPLHLRLQGELWESRPVWDRLVYPAIVRVIRITRDAVPATATSMPVTLDLGNA